MASKPSTMLLRHGARCVRNDILPRSIGLRCVSSGPIVGSDVIVPPDSPRFVYIPKPPQTAPIIRLQQKGTLPRPRSPLKRTNSQLPWHLENTAPEAVLAKSPGLIPAKDKEYIEWKTRESELRKQNFREGYTELRTREARERRATSAYRNRGAAAKIKARMDPEKFYEEMSRPSVLSFMDQKDTWLAGQRTKEDLAVRKAKYAELEEAKEYERRTSLHTLYINAKHFIVTHEQLEQRLNKAFDSDFYQFNKNNDYGIWDEEGWPEDTSYLMNRARKSPGSSAVSQETGYTEIARKRIMKVTEEMTGGKLVHEESNTRAY